MAQRLNNSCFRKRVYFSDDLEPLAEVERALLVVEVFQLPGPKLGSLLGVGESGEHSGRENQVRFQ
jgi:hypothetical protein